MINKNNKYYTIPLFIPEEACPHQCVFCNQRKISGKLKAPTVSEVKNEIETYLSTIDTKKANVSIAFFGGNFTGIKEELMIEYLESVQEYIKLGISGIKLSTRPDYIDKHRLDILKKYNVSCIELGCQTMDEEVLIKAGRGHTIQDTIKSAKLIKDYGFELGLQMMLGLPGDTKEKSIETAKKIVALKADNTRIYPTAVIKGTALSDLFIEGKYKPLTMDEAIEQAAEVYKIFEANKVKILRVGLHPSEDLLNSKELIAGPYHQSFREMVLTKLWNETLLKKIDLFNLHDLIIEVAPLQINYAIGFESKNKKELLSYFKKVTFKTNKNLTGRNFNAIYN